MLLSSFGSGVDFLGFVCLMELIDCIDWFNEIVRKVLCNYMFWTFWNDYVNRFISSHPIDGAIRLELKTFSNGTVCADYDTHTPHLDFSYYRDRKLSRDGAGYSA